MQCQECATQIGDLGWCIPCHDREHSRWLESCERCRKRALKTSVKAYMAPSDRRRQQLRDAFVRITASVTLLAVGALVVWFVFIYVSNQNATLRDCTEAKMSEYRLKYGPLAENFEDEAKEDCQRGL